MYSKGKGESHFNMARGRFNTPLTRLAPSAHEGAQSISSQPSHASK